MISARTFLAAVLLFSGVALASSSLLSDSTTSSSFSLYTEDKTGVCLVPQSLAAPGARYQASAIFTFPTTIEKFSVQFPQPDGELSHMKVFTRGDMGETTYMELLLSDADGVEYNGWSTEVFAAQQSFSAIIHSVPLPESVTFTIESAEPLKHFTNDPVCHDVAAESGSESESSSDSYLVIDVTEFLDYFLIGFGLSFLFAIVIAFGYRVGAALQKKIGASEVTETSSPDDDLEFERFPGVQNGAYMPVTLTAVPIAYNEQILV